MRLLEVAVDEQRKIGVIPDITDPKHMWHVVSRNLGKEPWYLPITEEEIEALFAVPVRVVALPKDKYPFPTKFKVWTI